MDLLSVQFVKENINILDFKGIWDKTKFLMLYVGTVLVSDIIVLMDLWFLVIS